ncbi:MAG: ABC transporter ATP-binding protein [Oxalobacter sp.]|nr:ABC transporter ATP-binding protein [Oxalobacter sp.]
MIELSHVSKVYGETPVVDDISLVIPAGGITSLIGPNGAGKSTLLSMISRITPMTGGTVTVDGLDVSTTAGDILAKKLSFLRQDNVLSVRLTVRDLVTFGRYPYSKGRPTEKDREYIDRAIAFLALDDIASRFLDELSGGQRQRAFVAMVLCQDTDYLLLDEPLNSLDMRHAVDMMKLLRRLAVEFGKTIVIVLHDINFASSYSDHIIALKNGRVIRQGPPADIMNAEALHAIYDMTINVQEINGIPIAIYYA